MSDLYLRIDAKQNVVLYRTRTNQGVFMTRAEHHSLILLGHLRGYEPYAVNVGEAGYDFAPAELHRRVVMRGKRLVIEPGLHEPDLFDVRRVEDC